MRKIIKRIIIGRTDKVKTARMMGISSACSPLNCPSASGRVFFAGVIKNVFAKANSFHIATPL